MCNTSIQLLLLLYQIQHRLNLIMFLFLCRSKIETLQQCHDTLNFLRFTLLQHFYSVAFILFNVFAFTFVQSALHLTYTIVCTHIFLSRSAPSCRLFFLCYCRILCSSLFLSLSPWNVFHFDHNLCQFQYCAPSSGSIFTYFTIFLLVFSFFFIVFSPLYSFSVVFSQSQSSLYGCDIYIFFFLVLHQKLKFKLFVGGSVFSVYMVHIFKLSAVDFLLSWLSVSLFIELFSLFSNRFFFSLSTLNDLETDLIFCKRMNQESTVLTKNETVSSFQFGVFFS